MTTFTPRQWLQISICVFLGVFWDMGRVHCGICEIGLFDHQSLKSYNAPVPYSIQNSIVLFCPVPDVLERSNTSATCSLIAADIYTTFDGLRYFVETTGCAQTAYTDDQGRHIKIKDNCKTYPCDYVSKYDMLSWWPSLKLQKRHLISVHPAHKAIRSWSDNWSLICCQCTETSSHVSSIQK